MTLFPAVFALRNTRVHICTINGYNIASNVKASVKVPNIYLDNGHIRLGQSLNDLRFRYEQ